MNQAYFDHERESDPYSLPDCEVFYRTISENISDGWIDDDGEPLEAGWYWWTCFPGCLPDSEPMGPFATEQEALDDARDGLED